MKRLFLVPVLLLTALLTACSSSNYALTSPSQPVTADDLTLETPVADTGVLEDFVNALNNQQLNGTMDLFNEDAVFTEINEVGLGPNPGSQGWAFNYNGKDQIKTWVKDEQDVNLQIEPLSYTVAGQTATLEAFFYYPSQQIKARLDTTAENGRFKTFYYYIESIKLFYSDSNP